MMTLHNSNKMSETEFMKSHCDSCSEPLFLSAKECRDWIENKLKQGYIVCRCCGAKKTMTESPSKPD